MKQDLQWLQQYQGLIRHKKVLELGCGSGMDTRILSEWATSLVACDLTPRVDPTVTAVVMTLDHSKSLPFEPGQFDIVIASLCLHYFHWQHTEAIVADITRLLTPGGLLICRLNSDRDIHFGATGHREIEAGLFDVNGSNKRFFKRCDVLRLFREPWHVEELTRQNIDRYNKVKSVWTLCARNPYHRTVAAP